MLLGCFFFTMSMAESKGVIGKKPIYKWEQNGLIHYSHIKPEGIKNATKLDANGREIEEYSKEFNEIEQIVIRPKNLTITKTTGLATDDEIKRLKQKANEKMKEQNCQTTHKNLEALNQDEVYETDSKGNKIRLTDEQLKIKRKNVERDFKYFCSE